jgi:hypothetical protein
MSMNNLSLDEAAELIARSRRTETKLSKLMLFLGIDNEGGTTMPITLRQSELGPELSLPGHDVTLASIKRVLEEQQAVGGEVPLLVSGVYIGTIKLKR